MNRLRTDDSLKMPPACGDGFFFQKLPGAVLRHVAAGCGQGVGSAAIRLESPESSLLAASWQRRYAGRAGSAESSQFFGTIVDSNARICSS